MSLRNQITLLQSGEWDIALSKFKVFIFLIILVELLIILIGNGVYLYGNSPNSGKIYRVEAKRVIDNIEDNNLTEEEILSLDLSQYETLVGIRVFDVSDRIKNDYLVEEINGKLYCIEYSKSRDFGTLIYMNVALLVMVVVTVVVLIYVNNKIIKPFHSMSNLSYELAKGNLSTPVKEEKSRFFGRFMWGMDMLREKLEDNKAKELEFQKERKTLILSLSHDIKTPLSSIELYSKAMSEGVYDTPEKMDEALGVISKNVKEIKGYVDEIVKTSREDFLNLEVITGEFYLSDIMRITKEYYKDKLSSLHTELKVDDCLECLISGDQNRMVEVIQNIMENAIKYGDGKWIHIWVDEEEDCKLIHIENSGCTLKEEELPNIFDSFYRGTNTNNIKGSGLGLYICRNLMRKMDGDIYANIKPEAFCVTVVARKS